MISPSDAVPDINVVVAGKLLQDAGRAQPVCPLEFEAIDHPLRRKTDWMHHEDEADALTKRLRDEMAALDGRFRAQTQHVATQVAEAQREAKLEARVEWEVELEERIAQERARIVETCADFAKQRASYFVAVEGEVVRLALAIAERVLHREAKLDPLLLGGVVRVALEKVAENSGAVLHVPGADAEAWRSILTNGSEAAVTVVGDERMEATGCVLETSVGRVELGVVAQLAEIEKGFFDLMQQRPT